MCDSISNACNTIGNYGAQTCTKLGEWGGAAGTWIVENGSELAAKVKDFVMNTVWPSVQQFWEWLTSLCRSSTHLAKAHPKEAGALAVAGAGIGATAVGAVASCFLCKGGKGKKDDSSSSKSSKS